MKFIALALVALVTGCASVPRADLASETLAKEFRPPADKANIYVARPAKVWGAAIMFQVILDQRNEGGIGPNNFLLLSTTPGEHTVTIFSAEQQASVAVNCEAGQNYFVRVGVRPGVLSARQEVHLITSVDEGKALILGGQMAKGLR